MNIFMFDAVPLLNGQAQVLEPGAELLVNFKVALNTMFPHNNYILSLFMTLAHNII